MKACRCLALALILVAPVACGAEERLSGRPAVPADRFVDSIGVNVHMSYDNTAYGNVPAIRDALRELGARHVRDGIVVGRRDQFSALRALAADGVRTNLILGDPQGRFGTGTLTAQLNTLRGELLGTADTVEGPNEYDSSGDPETARRLREYQQSLFGAIRREPAFAELAVVGPSLIDGSRWPEVGDLTRSLDYGNIHPYPGGEAPSADALEGQVELVRPGSGARPVFATETGYHNALAAGPDAQPGVSERAAATYLPITLLEHFRAGIRRTFLYELADERPEPNGNDAEQHFGLVRSDFSRKPGFNAVANLIDLLADSGSAFEPAPLDYGLKAGTSVRELVLQKADGRFYLALWRPVGVWSDAERVDVPPAHAAVEVTLRRPFERARLYSPVRSPRPVESWETGQPIRLQLGGEPLVLEIEEE